MAEPIGALRAQLEANAAQFAADMRAARSAVQTASAQIQRSFAQMSRNANQAYKSIFSLRNLMLGGSATAAILFVKRMAEAADQMQSTSQAIGITAEQFQEIQYAATQLGVAVDEDLTKALARMVRGMGDAQQGNGKFAEGLGLIGLTLEDIKGKNPVEVLQLISTQMAKIEDPARRAAAGAILFGKGWLSMGAFLTAGGAAIEEQIKKARDLGLVVSNEMVARAAAAADEFDTMGAVFRVAGINLAAEFLPVIKDLAKIMTSQAFQQGMKDFASQLREVVQFIADNIDLIERFVIAFAGMKAGAALGSIAGKRGKTVGGVMGAVAGFFQPEIAAAFSEGSTSGLPQGSQPLEITVTKGILTKPPAADVPIIDPGAQEEAKKAVDEVVESLLDEWQTLGMTDAELKVYNALKEAGVTANSEAGQTIAALVQNITAEKNALEETIKALDTARGMAKDFLSTFVEGLRAGKTWSEALYDAVGKLVDKLLDASLDQAVSWLFGATGTASGGVLGGLFSLLGFAQGGSFKVGGSGGQDSQLVAFKATPGETVDIRTPGQDTGGAGGQLGVFVSPSPYFDVRVERISGRVANEASAAQIAGFSKNQARQRALAA